ncbi:hypothetical protein PILCRDRAFT_10276 [Piloderma croceum F 1598]|uniref:Uncharacterized protein n=1 Tax=Piloderma croceum (strain F 1598) TaxID=765440 RepID=A0A0C3AZL7_PILCF|nr:hypothetical protein PILCRDRAFT_10276 [Piloderma croceum F 1598]
MPCDVAHEGGGVPASIRDGHARPCDRKKGATAGALRVPTLAHTRPALHRGQLSICGNISLSLPHERGPTFNPRMSRWVEREEQGFRPSLEKSHARMRRLPGGNFTHSQSAGIPGIGGLACRMGWGVLQRNMQRRSQEYVSEGP